MLDLIQWRARKSPEAPALFFNGRWYSYREMEARANRLANRLRDLGVQQGDRVGVLAYNHPVHFDLLLAAPKLGIVFVPFNYQCSASELNAAARRVPLALLFVDSRHQALAEGMGVPWTRLSDYRDWLAAGSVEAPPPLPRTLTVDDPHVVFFTDRGAAWLPYRQTLLNARHAADAWGLSTQDSAVHCLPCHSPALHLLCLPLLYRGGRVVLMSIFEPDEYLGHLALHRVSVGVLTAPMLRLLTEYSDFEEADLSSLEWLACVGPAAPLPVRHALFERGVRLRGFCLLAETGPNLFHAPIDEADARPELLGSPLPETGIRLRRADGSDAPVGEVAELTASGPMVFGGYLGDDSLTAASLRDGVLWSGQLLVEEPGSRFAVVGRLVDRFVSQGTVIDPGLVEQALLRVEGVMDCAVFPVPDSQRGQAIVAALVLQEGVQRDDASLRQALREQLLESRTPGYFYRLRALPRDAWGYVKRQELTQLFIQSCAAQTARG